jgi:hypothetical protein
VALEIVQGMELQPNTCLLCSNNPVDEMTGDQKKAIFAGGVDVDWGNSVYICWECGHLIADLVGRSTKEGFDKVVAEKDELQAQYNELLEKYEEEHELVEKIRAGNEAIKKVKAA